MKAALSGRFTVFELCLIQLTIVLRVFLFSSSLPHVLCIAYLYGALLGEWGESERFLEHGNGGLCAASAQSRLFGTGALDDG